MPFQSTIALDQAYGLPGELRFEGPTRVTPGVTKGTAANIIVGSAFTIDTADGKYQPGGTGVFGGIMINGLEQACYGTTAGGPLAPSQQVPVGVTAQFCEMGFVCVRLQNAATIGQGVYFVQATGLLFAGTAGAGQTQIANAKVVRETNGAAGLAVISLLG